MKGKPRLAPAQLLEHVERHAGCGRSVFHRDGFAACCDRLLLRDQRYLAAVEAALTEVDLELGRARKRPLDECFT
jgi:hypothetical protein